MQYKVFRCRADYSDISLVIITGSRAYAYAMAEELERQGWCYSIVTLRKQPKGA